mgnify:CR=1 FL=1
MNNIRRRLVLLGIAIMVSLITVVSTTYAFIILNDEAKISEVDFEIENQDGLLLSLDGENYYQDLSYQMIAKAIIEAQGGTYTDDTDNVLDNFKISGVQMATNGTEVAKGTSTLGATVSFVKDSLNKVQDPNTPALNDEWYEHEMIDADAFSYITFDLWCKVETNAMTEAELEKGYELYFSSRTALTVKGSIQKVSLVNSLTTQTEEMETGEQLEVNPVDAMRIAVLDRETEDLLVFEPYEGLGSSAVEGRTGVNDPTKNAMYTYYNNTHPLSPFTSAAEENEQFDTVVGLSELTTTKLGVFKYTPNPANKDINDNFNVVKLTVMIYMDGWDADYFMGINETNLQVKLGFEIKPIA